MHKFKLQVSHFILLSIALLTLGSTELFAGGGHSFWGFGPGIEVLSKDGTGTGFYTQAFAGHNFNSHTAIGGHLGYSNAGGINVQAWDFGSFVQLTEPDSGLFGRFYLDAVHMATSGGAVIHGVNGSQFGLASGFGVGMFIPSIGNFHLVPEMTYKAAFLQSVVNMVGMTFSVMWDF